MNNPPSAAAPSPNGSATSVPVIEAEPPLNAATIQPAPQKTKTAMPTANPAPPATKMSDQLRLAFDRE
jgi:hypothetical protein